MSSWDGNKIVRYKPYPHPQHAGWMVVDCGCCGGIQWAHGDSGPEECDDCGGGGRLVLHLSSRRLALWPGGPFRGAPVDPKDYGVLPEAVV